MQLSYSGNPNTAGKCNKLKSKCKNKNTIEIIKWLSGCNCIDKGNYVSFPLAKCRTGSWTGLMCTAKNCLGTPLKIRMSVLRYTFYVEVPSEVGSCLLNF